LEGPAIIDWTDKIHDFSDTAALIQDLDLVIAVDTSIAHLAGAMAKPFGFSIALTSNGVGYPIVPGIQPRGCLGNLLQVIGSALSIA
jgi:glycosyl transferase family 9 (putative heptosyltransferase)